jgi:short-subunit dehydrogenase
MKNSKNGKIIEISGARATQPIPMLNVYATSKARIVQYIETVVKEVNVLNIDVNTVSTVALNTGMFDEILNAGPNLVVSNYYKKAMQQKLSGISFDYATNFSLFYASDKSKGIGGKLISVLWVKWEDWTKNINEIQNTYIYTLRQITGRNSRKFWGDK